MHAFTEAQLRACFINTTLRERKAMPMPDALDTIDWTALDYLGWRDRRQPNVGYVVIDADGEAVGILLRRTSTKTRTRPQCAWCEDISLPNDVGFFSAKRAGAAGRSGDTVGTLLCADFECSKNVRNPPPIRYSGMNIDEERSRRIRVLREHAAGFAAAVR